MSITEQVTFTEAEILADHDYAAPLIADGTRCHGGFDADGTYVSPRTKFRVPAIDAWQAQHVADSGEPVRDLPLDTWPEHYPNVAQAKHLIRNGVPGPVIATLTRIGTVEGFGAMLRHLPVPDLQALFDDDISGTATAHIAQGLFEAHARDEAGHDDEGGHDTMWFAARDIAFERPVTADETATMLARMGIGGPGAAIDPEERMRLLMERRLFTDLPYEFEALVEQMNRLLLIEISAFHAFAWAEAVLSDHQLVAGEGEAARLVSYIRADETPHVGYLKTVLSEMSVRTLKTTTGAKIAGRDVIDAIWARALDESLNVRRTEQLTITRKEVAYACGDNTDLLEEFDALGSVRPAGDGTWITV